MPINETFRPLISRLIEATNKRSVSWSEGPATFSHSTSLSNFSVRVTSTRNTQQQLQPASSFSIIFAALDARGQPIDQFQVAPNEKDYPLMLQLYEAAHRSSRKIDEKVAEMLRELDQKSQ